METTTNTESNSVASSDSIVSTGSPPDNEASGVSPDVQFPHADTESHPSRYAESPPADSEPNIMLAPTTKPSPDRDRTLIEEGSKSTPETAHSHSKSEVDLEDGQILFKENEDETSVLSEDGGGGGANISRKKLLICFGMALLICFVAGFLGDYLSRKKRNETFNAFVKTTNSPTWSTAPAFRPTGSPALTLSRQPSPGPTISASPSKTPTAAPTPSPSAAPTTSPSAAPTQYYVALIQDFLFGSYGVDVFSGSEVANTNDLAIEWLGLEATESRAVELNGKLVQRFALVAVDLSLQGAKTAGDAPRNAQLGVDECDWKGIRCDSENLVEEISWDYQPKGKNGSGTISPGLRLLVGTLKVLDLSNNGLVGSIPEELYALTNLEKLFLFKNQLEGTISTKISDFDSITHFHLSHNKLLGEIPNQVKSDSDGIRPLEYFNLYSNQLTGTLPEDMRLRNCIYFDVGRNSLTGTLPVDLGEKFVALRHLHVDHNKFTGTLPSSYNTVGNGRLESFSINHNYLTGVIPGARDMDNKLVQYSLQSNLFDKMESQVCRMEIPRGEMVELRTDCDVCRCSGFFDLCDIQCL